MNATKRKKLQTRNCQNHEELSFSISIHHKLYLKSSILYGRKKRMIQYIIGIFQTGSSSALSHYQKRKKFLCNSYQSAEICNESNRILSRFSTSNNTSIVVFPSKVILRSISNKLMHSLYNSGRASSAEISSLER